MYCFLAVWETDIKQVIYGIFYENEIGIKGLS